MLDISPLSGSGTVRRTTIDRASASAMTITGLLTTSEGAVARVFTAQREAAGEATFTND
jgi:hypothetical protein